MDSDRFDSSKMLLSSKAKNTMQSDGFHLSEGDEDEIRFGHLKLKQTDQGMGANLSPQTKRSMSNKVPTVQIVKPKENVATG